MTPQIINLTGSQVEELDGFIKRERSAFEFWKQILGAAQQGRVWRVERLNSNTCSVLLEPKKIKR